MTEVLKKQARLDYTTAPSPTKLKRTPQGGLLLDCAPTRCGVLTYTYPDGTKVRELRHPDEVFRADSLESLAGAPVTVLHPTVPVTGENWNSLAKGHIGDDPHPDGMFVAAKARIQDSGTTQKVLNRELCEMSCGYDADVVMESGEYNGERYDAIQRNIRYNHVALGPKNWGRAGNDVGLRMDAASYTLIVDHLDAKDGGDTVTFDASQFVARADHDKLVGEKDAKIAQLETQLSAATKRADSAEQLAAPANLDKLVTERLAIVDTARGVLGKEFKADGKSAHEIRLEVVKKARPSLKLDGASESYVEGVFAGIASAESAATASHAQVAKTVETQRTDAGETQDKVGSAYSNMIKDLHGQFKENK